MKQLPPQYIPHDVESRVDALWTQLGIFEAGNTNNKNYTILLPPPNVTGVLHMGHALTCTLEDILIRRKRMMGFNTLWLPGTDHAGIATQMVVERELLQREKKTKHDLGREEFLKRVWEWKERSQSTILSQLRKIGSSVDWSRLRFTLDEGASRAVREAFVRLFREGLIYQDEAMIQWCPRCQTALSDLEVKYSEREAKLWHIRYALRRDPSQYLVVATTRPETLLGDMAVAVHPEDGRFKKFHGEVVVLPLLGRDIPVICDSYVDREFGTGALKVTPGHDPNDYLIGKNHSLGVVTVLDTAARINEHGGKYQGLSREKAREAIVLELQALGLLEKEVSHVSKVGSCDRCGTVVEPRVSRQWFVRAETLAGPAIAAVESKKIKIIPREWEKTYFEWMRNIRPWCISRQLWWGHRIPVWYCRRCHHVCASVETAVSCEQCQSTDVYQDEDVLDTWFSSGLWPLSTLGWPDDSEDLKRFYPSDVMETGFDILFFWVARMVMLGIHFKKEVPFHTVFLHPMVRDEHGQKMSKTRGNVKDPLEIINTKGADALRFTLCAMAVHGRDVLLSDNRIEGYRNFVNKLWNATRFVLMHFSQVDRQAIRVTDPVNQWILTRLNRVKKEVNGLWDEYRFFEAAEKLYHFVWNDYCDRFLEFIKRKGELDSRKQLHESTAVEVLEEILRLLHPVIPFVTEELWQNLPFRSAGSSIAVAGYPTEPLVGDFDAGEAQVSHAIELIEAIRTVRGENGLTVADTIEVRVFASESVKDELRPMLDLIADSAHCSRVTLLDPDQIQQFTGEKLVLARKCQLSLVLPERKGEAPSASDLSTQIEALENALSKTVALLGNSQFFSKAPASVVEKERAKEKDLRSKLDALRASLLKTDQ